MLSFFKKFAERKENKEDDGTAKGFMSHCRAAISNALFVNAIGLTYLICKDTETISFAHDKSSTDPTKVNSEVPVLWLRTEMGMVIAAAFLKKEGAKQTILCSHGNAEDMGESLRMAKLLQERLNVNVMVYEYTGFGYSDKVPRKNGVATTEAHIYADIKAAYTWLVNMGTKESDIIVMGRSFGSGPSVELVATQEVGGLVLISAFASVLRVASPWLRHTVRSFDMFCNVDKMSKVQCPVFSVHGKKDEIVPMRQAKLLLSKAKSQSYVPFWLPEAGHNDVAFCEWGELVLHFEEFFSNIEKGTLFGRYYRRNKFAF